MHLCCSTQNVAESDLANWGQGTSCICHSNNFCIFRIPYNAIKPPATTYNQHPTQQPSNGTSLTVQAPQSYYVLADTAQPNSDVIQYVPTEQPAAAYGAGECCSSSL